MTIKAIIFDIGDVLCTPLFKRGEMSSLFDVSAEEFHHARLGPWDDYVRGKIDGPEFFRRIAANLKKDIDPEETFKKTYDLLKADKDMFELAKALKDDGYQLAIISNNSCEWARYEIDDLGLRKLFDTIILSCDTGLKKPEKEIYEICLEKLDLPAEQCLFIDDKKHNTDVAEELGIDTIQFTGIKRLKEKLRTLNIRIDD